jgi:hypothetical protein
MSAEELLKHATCFQFGGLPANRARRVEDLPYIVEARDSKDGTRRWALMQGGNCMHKSGEWEIEPSPSNRSDAFLRTARWDFGDAIAMAQALAQHQSKGEF